MINKTPAPTLPTQIATWLPDRSEYDLEIHRDAHQPEWLHCLRDTQPRDRQAVWSGVNGQGLVGVVDFGDSPPRRRQVTNQRKTRTLWEGWGIYTPVNNPVPVKTLQADPDLRYRFAESGRHALIGPIRLNDHEARAINRLAGGLPPAADPGPPDHSAPSGSWSGRRLDPEEITELLVYDNFRLATRLGFARPLGRQRALENGMRPDLLSAGVVGEVKNLVTRTRGPQQVFGYIGQCDRQWPDQAPWRGVLIQGEPEPAAGVCADLDASRYRDRIELWTVTRRPHFRWGHRAIRLYP